MSNDKITACVHNNTITWTKDNKFLNQVSDKFTIVLNDNELHLFKDSRNIVKQLTCVQELCVLFIACIYHDKDKADDGVHFKTPHYHVVMSIDRKCRIGTMLNLISDVFKCNLNQITIDKCTSLAMQSRYLIHLDDFDKERYDVWDVITNHQDKFENFLNLSRIVDIDDCVTICKHYNYDIEELMVHVANFKQWRPYIKDLVANHYRKKY